MKLLQMETLEMVGQMRRTGKLEIAKIAPEVAVLTEIREQPSQSPKVAVGADGAALAAGVPPPNEIQQHTILGLIDSTLHKALGMCYPRSSSIKS